MGMEGYRAVAQLIRDRIASGRYRRGERLPAQTALARELGVDRNLVRRAQGHLIERGILQSWQGSGVIVAVGGYNYPIFSRTRFSEQLRANGHTTSTEYLGVKQMRGPYPITRLLQLPASARVLRVELRRLVDGIPAMIAQHFYDPQRVPGIEHLVAETLSVTEAMRRLGIEIIRASTTATTRIARPAEAILLGTPPLQPVIEITGMNTDPAGAPVEVSVAIARGDRIRLAILNEPDASQETTPPGSR